MASPDIHLDLSEIVAKPIRSGIQRVEREAIRHWPGPARLRPCCIDETGQLLLLPDAVLDVLCSTGDAGTAASRNAEQDAMTAFRAAAVAVPPHELRHVLNLELFFSATRAEAYLRMAQSGVRVSWYIYDFLPFLRPDLFPPGGTRYCNYFLRGLRSAGHLAFLSEQTRRDYVERIARTSLTDELGPVIHPGADGLRLERQVFSPQRRDFVSIGTIEPRKNTAALLQAFEAIWQSGHNVRLIVGGQLSPDATYAAAFFERHASDPRLSFFKHPSDETIRQALRGARALIMPSEAEGFGLPPYEALNAGIPSIASARLPSAGAMSRGALLLDRMDPQSIAAAVESLLSDDRAAKLWQDASRVQLPSWADFGQRLGEWVQTH